MTRKPRDGALRVRDLDLAVGGASLRARLMLQPRSLPDSRPPLVFLHDSLGCIASWRDFPARLAVAAGCDALVYDRRGYGESDPVPAEPRSSRYLEEEADALVAVLDACGIPAATLFGHSDGGSIALLAAARYSARVRAVVTEGAHVFVEDVTLTGIRNTSALLETTGLRDRLAVLHGAKADRVVSSWVETWLRPDFRDWNIEEFLPRIEAPVLVIQGEHDEFGTGAQVDAIVGGTGERGEPLVVPGVGHTPHRDAADEVIEATVRFLGRRGVVPR